VTLGIGAFLGMFLGKKNVFQDEGDGYAKVHHKSSVQFWYKNKKKSTMDIEGSKTRGLFNAVSLVTKLGKTKKIMGKDWINFLY
jgi:hypothetical protein